MSDTKTATAQVLYPAIRYSDAHAAIRFLTEAFGFVTDVVYEGQATPSPTHSCGSTVRS